MTSAKTLATLLLGSFLCAGTAVAQTQHARQDGQASLMRLPPDDPDDPPGGGGSVPSGYNMIIGSQCYLPGPLADDRCTVMYEVHDNPAGRIVCLWSGDQLTTCEGRTVFGGVHNWVRATGATLEFRIHSVFPSQDPAWPDAHAVRLKGTLVKQQQVAAKRRTSPTPACSVTVQPGQSIRDAVASGATTVCLASNVHPMSATASPRAGQVIRSASKSAPATIKLAGGSTAFDVRTAGVTIKDLLIESTASSRGAYAVNVSGASDLLVDNVDVRYVKIPFAITQSANVELRETQLTYPGDGQACAGCAHPAIWINQSDDVRVVGAYVLGNGQGPEGDGELGCYDSTNLLVQGSTFSQVGAGGIYLVNCDRSMVLGNLVSHAGEWGMDIVKAGSSTSGTDLSLFAWNRIEYSAYGGAVLLDSRYNTFVQNTYIGNLTANSSGECNGVNLRGDTTGFYSYNDYGQPWPVYCND